jgi:oligoribonuclease NrnB/cAMP/cGMP phosphodiesterase (DHH superfamily)
MFTIQRSIITECAPEDRILIKEDNTAVVYHGNCPDGITAAWVFYEQYPDCHYFSYLHGTPLLLDESIKTVVMLDLCLPMSWVSRALDNGAKIIVCDHHASNYDGLTALVSQYPDLVEVYFSTLVSGAMATALFLEATGRVTNKPLNHVSADPGHPYSSHPLVQYTQDRDLWKWKLSLSREVNAAIQLVPKTVQDWRLLADQWHTAGLIADGRVVLQRERQFIEAALNNARDALSLEHKTVKLVNSADLQSEIGEQLSKLADYAVVWFQRRDGKYVYSLRSRPTGEDVSLIARKLGGGGHTHAAGFTHADPPSRFFTPIVSSGSPHAVE